MTHRWQFKQSDASCGRCGARESGGKSDTISKTFGDVSIYPRDQRFIVQQSAANGGGTVTVRRPEALPLADALAAWVNAGHPGRNGKRAAFLVGGLRHGEFVAVENPGQQIFTVTTSKPTGFSGAGESPPTFEQHTDTYTQMNDQPSGLPFDIYEHASVAKANVKRRVKQLDADILWAEHNAEKAGQTREVARRAWSKSAEQIDALRNQIKALERDRNAAESRSSQQNTLFQAKTADYNAAIDKLRELREERTQIGYDYGI